MPMRPSKRARRKKALLKRDGAQCSECGAPDQPPDPRKNKRGEIEHHAFLTIDHIVATRDGGDDEMENLRLLCAPCHRKSDNMKKGGYHPDTGELSPDYIKHSRRYKRLRETSRRPE